MDDWKQDHFYGMKAFFDRTFVNGNGAGGFLGEHEFGTARFKTTEGVERPARMMFLTGRKVTEPEAGRDASGEEKKKEKERLQKALKEKAPPPSPRFSAGRSSSRWRWRPATASSSRGRSSIAPGTGSSAAGW